MMDMTVWRTKMRLGQLGNSSSALGGTTLGYGWPFWINAMLESPAAPAGTAALRSSLPDHACALASDGTSAEKLRSLAPVLGLLEVVG